MQFFPNPSTILQIGTFAIRWYAVLILTGAFIAYALSLREFKKMGYDDLDKWTTCFLEPSSQGSLDHVYGTWLFQTT
ncbi:MAG: prolipoprotein diacylglyceryl transferase [Erysipelotrichaceae bacterium]|nr:prolipoprotein diacylglyceryl transferase [Erysipelotrichaceae bacterium]